MELETVQLIISNRFEGLLAQDHVQNMIALVEVQKNIVKVQSIFAQDQNDRF